MSVKKKVTTQPTVLTSSLDKILSRMRTAQPNRRIGEMPFDNTSYAAKSASYAMACLQRIQEGVGNFKDWNALMYRMYVGVFADEHYFKENEDTVLVLNHGIEVLQLIMVRTHCVGVDGFGVRVGEYQALINALHMVDTLIKFMYPKELTAAYTAAEEFMDKLVADNTASDLQQTQHQLVEHEVRQVLSELAQEHQEVHRV